MHVQRLTEGLWRWTAPHPHWTPAADGPTGWPQQVGSLYFEPPGEASGVVLVDPLVPAAEAASFWKHLDSDVARRGGGVVIVITNAWHGRSADAVRERYGAEVHAHRVAAGDVQAVVTHPFDGDEAGLPGGLSAHHVTPCDGGECVVELPGGAGLAFGDCLVGIGGGRVRTLPTAWAPEAGRATFQARLREVLRPLLARPFERLLVTHGEPVLQAAHEAFEGALVAPPQGG